MNARIAPLLRFDSFAWRSALQDAFVAGLETARLNPGIAGEVLWREHGPASDPTSWEAELGAGEDGDDVVAEVLDHRTARRAFLMGVAEARAGARTIVATGTAGTAGATAAVGADASRLTAGRQRRASSLVARKRP